MDDIKEISATELVKRPKMDNPSGNDQVDHGMKDHERNDHVDLELEQGAHVEIDQGIDMENDQGIDMENDQGIDMDPDQCIDRTNDFPTSALVLYRQGAEARIYRGCYLGKSVMVKERFPKSYRHQLLDDQLRKERLKSEIRCMARCRSVGIAVPPLYFVDPFKNRLVIGYIEDSLTVREYIAKVYSENELPEDRHRLLIPVAQEIGRILASLHSNDIIHGDLTTSNMLIRHSSTDQVEVIMIDFGLSYIERLPEDKGVDLYVLEKAFLSTHPNSEPIFDAILDSYGKCYAKGGKKALEKLAEVRLRGRKREMIG